MSAAASSQKQSKITKKKPRGKPFEKGQPTAFKKGQSGNPGGRPKGVSLTASLLRLLAKEVRKGQHNADEIAQAILNKALEGDVKAFVAIADRTEGKPEANKNIKQDVTVRVIFDDDPRATGKTAALASGADSDS